MFDKIAKAAMGVAKPRLGNTWAGGEWRNSTRVPATPLPWAKPGVSRQRSLMRRLDPRFHWTPKSRRGVWALPARSAS